MTPQDLELAGRKLFGHRWKAPLARSLGRDPSMIWRYVTGQAPIPPLVEMAVKNFLSAKATQSRRGERRSSERAGR